MAQIWMVIILALLFIALCCLGVWLVIVFFGNKKLEKDDTYALNFLSNIEDGYFLGKIVDTITAKNNRKIIEIEPRDINPDEVQKNIKVIVDNDKVIYYPKGTLSKRKNLALLLPPSPSDLSGHVKNSLLGKALMWAIELDNAAKTQIEILEEGIKRKNNLAKDIGTGELTTKWIEFNRNVLKDYTESLISKKENKNNVPGFGNQPST